MSSIKFLLDLVALQGGAIISASELTEEEAEHAKYLKHLAEENGHTYVYKGKIWMARVKYLLSEDERRGIRDITTREEWAGTGKDPAGAGDELS